MKRMRKALACITKKQQQIVRQCVAMCVFFFCATIIPVYAQQENNVTPSVSEAVEQGAEEVSDGVEKLTGILGEIFSLKTLINLSIAVVLIIIGYIISRNARRIVKKQIVAAMHGEQEHREKIASLLGSITSTSVFFFFLFVALGVLGLKFDFFLGGLSVGLGFALKEIIENFIAGLFVLTTKEFKIGDIIKFEGKYGFIGRIEEINLRYTVMRTFDMRRVVVPNIDIISNPMKTYTAEEVVRSSITMTLSHTVVLGDVEQTIVDAVNSYDHIARPDATRLVLTGFGDAGMKLTVYFYINASFESAAGYVQSDVYKIVKATCDQHEIAISYPHTTLTVDGDDRALLKQAAAMTKVVDAVHKKE